MDLLKFIIGTVFVIAVAIFVWDWLVCDPCSRRSAVEDYAAYVQGPCLDGYIWNEKKDECI